jgi:hypothetical protein
VLKSVKRFELLLTVENFLQDNKDPRDVQISFPAPVGYADLLSMTNKRALIFFPPLFHIPSRACRKYPPYHAPALISVMTAHEHLCSCAGNGVQFRSVIPAFLILLLGGSLRIPEPPL